MSHFTVLVIGPNYEQQLAPFQENYMGDCPKQYLAFHEDEDCDVDETTGKKGYWENPNAKWDWYVVGGRWSGMLKVKPGVAVRVGEPGAFDNDPEPMGSDIVRKGDLDLEFMRNAAAEKAGAKYDRAMRIFGSLPPNKTWADIRGDSNQSQEIRNSYWEQPRCAAWQAEQKRLGYSDFGFGFDESPDNFLVTREKYVQSAMDRAGVTFAVVKDGKWYERGEMGWWACVSNEKDEETWNSMFANLLDSLPDDTELTLVDCHI